MPTFIATYDLKETSPDPHSKFLAQAGNFCWKLWILSSANEWFRLPNTTLEGTFDTMDTAVTALQATRAATEQEMGRSVTMEKWIVAQHNSAQFNSDTRQPNR